MRGGVSIATILRLQIGDCRLQIADWPHSVLITHHSSTLFTYHLELTVNILPHRGILFVKMRMNFHTDSEGVTCEQEAPTELYSSYNLHLAINSQLLRSSFQVSATLEILAWFFD